MILVIWHQTWSFNANVKLATTTTTKHCKSPNGAKVGSSLWWVFQLIKDFTISWFIFGFHVHVVPKCYSVACKFCGWSTYTPIISWSVNEYTHQWKWFQLTIVAIAAHMTESHYLECAALRLCSIQCSNTSWGSTWDFNVHRVCIFLFLTLGTRVEWFL